MLFCGSSGEITGSHRIWRPSGWLWAQDHRSEPEEIRQVNTSASILHLPDTVEMFVWSTDPHMKHLFVPVRYSHGPIPLQSQHYTTSQDIINSISIIQHEMRSYKPRLTQVHQREPDVDLWVDVWDLYSSVCVLFPVSGDVEQRGELRHHSAVAWRGSDAGRRPTDH